MLFRRFVSFALFTAASLLSAQQSAISGDVLDPQVHPVATSDKAYPPQLSGTVVDTSGAAIAGATVQVRSANGTVKRTTQSDRNGSFIFSGLAAGNYRLVVSNPDFETKEVPVNLGTTGTPAPLRISLAVSAVSTTINVQGREDDLIGIAESGTQGTGAQRKSRIVRFFDRERFWRRFPVSSSRNTPAAARPTNIIFAASILTTARILPFSSTICRLTCRRTRTARATRT